MTRPMDRTCSLPQIGKVNEDAGEFWAENPFQMPQNGQNLSAFERNRLFLNLGEREFMDISRFTAADIDSDSRSVIPADFDRDGRTDLLVASVGGGPVRLFLNKIPTKSKATRVRLNGTVSNRWGIGAKIRVTSDDTRIHRSVFPRNGCMGQGPAEILIAVPNLPKKLKIEVDWPSGTTQQLQIGSPPPHQITIAETEH